MAVRDLPTGDKLRWPPWCSCLTSSDADHHRTHVLVACIGSSCDLHREIGDIGRLCHARHGTDAAPQIIGNAGRFSVGAQGVLLHHPQIRAAVVEQHLAVIDHTAIHTRHRERDADQ